MLLVPQELCSKLVHNKTIAYISWYYGFSNRFLATRHPGDKGAGVFEQQDIMADLFEAHIGALSLEGEETGSDVLRRWMRSLWTEAVFPTLRCAADIEMIRAMGTSEIPRALKRARAGAAPDGGAWISY